MKILVVVSFLILIFQYSHGFKLEKSGQAEDELVAVAVLYRDGDRSPSSSFPNDQFFDISYFPMGFEQLTEKGKTRQYELGQWFRERYNDFLPAEFNIKDIYVRSSDTDRTLMSALLNLAGLYPPTDSQMWNKNILWQPIPVHTLPTNQDQVLYQERTCPKFNRLYADVIKNEFYQTINEAFVDFYNEVSNLTGWKIDNVNYFYKLNQILDIYESYDASFLPSWSSTIDREKLSYLAGLSFISYTFTDDLKRLGDGPFFDNLITGFDKVLDDSQEAPKFLMLSGHESTIGSVLNGMGLFDYKVPKFGSSLIWEVKKGANNDHYVNMFYKRDSSDTLDQLQLPGCDLDCPYETFKTILDPITVDLDSWDQECAESN